jgi:hypothetical protein
MSEGTLGAVGSYTLAVWLVGLCIDKVCGLRKLMIL